MILPRECKPWSVLQPDRARLSEPYLDAERARLVSTDGSAMVAVPVELNAGDVSGHVSSYMLKKLREEATKRREHSLYMECSRQARRGMRDLGEFPAWRDVLQRHFVKAVLASVSLDIRKLTQIADAMGTHSVELLLRGEMEAIEVRPRACRVEVIGAVGALMPLRITDEHVPPPAPVQATRWRGRRLLPNADI